MHVVDTFITLQTLKKMSETMFGSLVKAVVDIEKEIMVVDASLHSDQEEYLLEHGSLQNNLWGINLHSDEFGTEKFIEFDSMINLRPGGGNKSREVDDQRVREKIKTIVVKLVKL